MEGGPRHQEVYVTKVFCNSDEQLVSTSLEISCLFHKEINGSNLCAWFVTVKVAGGWKNLLLLMECWQSQWDTTQCVTTCQCYVLTNVFVSCRYLGCLCVLLCYYQNSLSNKQETFSNVLPVSSNNNTLKLTVSYTFYSRLSLLQMRVPRNSGKTLLWSLYPCRDEIAKSFFVVPAAGIIAQTLQCIWRWWSSMYTLFFFPLSVFKGSDCLSRMCPVGTT